MGKRRLVAALGVALVVLVACEGPRGVEAPYRAPLRDDVASGERLYLRDCAWCHGDRGEGTINYGPSIATEGPASIHFF